MDGELEELDYAEGDGGGGGCDSGSGMEGEGGSPPEQQGSYYFPSPTSSNVTSFASSASTLITLEKGERSPSEPEDADAELEEQEPSPEGGGTSVDSGGMEEQPELELPPGLHVLEDGEQEWTVEKILRKEMFHGIPNYRVKWHGWDRKYNTWEPIGNLSNCLEMVVQFEANLLLRKKNPRRRRTSSSDAAAAPKKRRRLSKTKLKGGDGSEDAKSRKPGKRRAKATSSSTPTPAPVVTEVAPWKLRPRRLAKKTAPKSDITSDDEDESEEEKRSKPKITGRRAKKVQKKMEVSLPFVRNPDVPKKRRRLTKTSSKSEVEAKSTPSTSEGGPENEEHIPWSSDEDEDEDPPQEEKRWRRWLRAGTHDSGSEVESFESTSSSSEEEEIKPIILTQDHPQMEEEVAKAHLAKAARRQKYWGDLNPDSSEEEKAEWPPLEETIETFDTKIIGPMFRRYWRAKETPLCILGSDLVNFCHFFLVRLQPKTAAETIKVLKYPYDVTPQNSVIVLASSFKHWFPQMVIKYYQSGHVFVEKDDPRWVKLMKEKEDREWSTHYRDAKEMMVCMLKMKGITVKNEAEERSVFGPTFYTDQENKLEYDSTHEYYDKVVHGGDGGGGGKEEVQAVGMVEQSEENKDEKKVIGHEVKSVVSFDVPIVPV